MLDNGDKNDIKFAFMFSTLFSFALRLLRDISSVYRILLLLLTEQINTFWQK